MVSFLFQTYDIIVLVFVLKELFYMDELNKALHTNFIDKSFPSNKDLRPKLFFNDYKRRMNLAFEITKRLK